MAGELNTDSVAFPQIALFTVLIMVLVWLLTKDTMWTVLAGGLAMYLGASGELESIGIGQKNVAYKCADYLVQEPALASDAILKEYQTATGQQLQQLKV